MFIPLQIENVFLEYGVVGALVVALGTIAYRQYNKDQEQSEEYRRDYMKNTEKFIELSTRIASNGEKLGELHEKQMAQNKEFFKSMNEKIDGVPAKVVERMKLDAMNGGKQNNVAS